jgi:hypothetical protein
MLNRHTQFHSRKYRFSSINRYTAHGRLSIHELQDAKSKSRRRAMPLSTTVVLNDYQYLTIIPLKADFQATHSEKRLLLLPVRQNICYCHLLWVKSDAISSGDYGDG